MCVSPDFDYTDKNQAVWSISPDGSEKEKIIDTIDYSMASIHTTKDNNKILLYGDNRPVVDDSKGIHNISSLFIVDNKSLQEFIPPLNFFSSEAISRDGRYVSFNSVGDQVGDLYLLDFTNNNYQIICKKNKDCRNGIWQN